MGRFAIVHLDGAVLIEVVDSSPTTAARSPSRRMGAGGMSMSVLS
jgi:hypothetical protein